MERIVAIGSSHLKCFDETWNGQAWANKKVAPSITKFHAIPGLKTLLPRTLKQDSDFINFQNKIMRAEEDTLILTTLSNDWQDLLFKDNKLLVVRDDILKKWSKATSCKKIKWKYRDFMLSKANEAHVKSGLNEYKLMLENTLRRSRLTTVYQMSVLERVYVNCNSNLLDFLFMFLNNILWNMISRLRIQNINGTQIKFRFISVAKQFIEARATDNGTNIFRYNEVKGLFGPTRQNNWDTHNLGNALVHRNDRSYKDLFREIEKIIQKDKTRLVL